MDSLFEPYEEKGKGVRINVPLDWRCITHRQEKVKPLFVNRKEGFRTYYLQQQYRLFNKKNCCEGYTVTEKFTLKKLKKAVVLK